VKDFYNPLLEVVMVVYHMTFKFKMGWRKDLPDFRDYTNDSVVVKDEVDKTGLMLHKSTLDAFVDLRQWCSPIEDQGSIGSCTAHAGVGLLEYFERKAFNRHIDASRLFLYKITRNLMREKGDTGAYLRTTMGALAMFGVPPEEYWPYDISQYDREPTPFMYSFAKEFQSIKYMRLDQKANNTVIDRNDVLTNIKASLCSQIPAMFGFTVYNGIDQAGSTGAIPYPSEYESCTGGHAVMAVGYNDSKVIKNTLDGSSTTGAILIRNSWSTSWGDAGYGWLPYKYVLTGLADDWWTIIDAKYVDTGLFRA
jgi:C1A family cysteine protease